MYKVCNRCETDKHITEYYLQKGMADGRWNTCKDCVRERVKKHSYTEHAREVKREWNKTVKGKAQQKRHTERFRRLNPEKYKAHQIAGNAVRDSRLVRQPCEVCGDTKSEMHHDDYSKPLEVRWFCRTHHKKLPFS